MPSQTARYLQHMRGGCRFAKQNSTVFSKRQAPAEEKQKSGYFFAEMNKTAEKNIPKAIKVHKYTKRKPAPCSKGAGFCSLLFLQKLPKFLVRQGGEREGIGAHHRIGELLFVQLQL